METPVIVRPYGSPTGDQYDPGMAKVERMSVEKVRPVLGQRIDVAKEEGTHTVIAKHGEDSAALVPMDWYREARRALGDPTDL